MYQFTISSKTESGENNTDYGNEKMKTLKMGSLRDTSKRPRENYDSINDDESNDERTPGFRIPVMINDRLNNTNIGITPHIMLPSQSSHDAPSSYAVQDSYEVVRLLLSPDRISNINIRLYSPRISLSLIT